MNRSRRPDEVRTERLLVIAREAFPRAAWETVDDGPQGPWVRARLGCLELSAGYVSSFDRAVVCLCCVPGSDLVVLTREVGESTGVDDLRRVAADAVAALRVVAVAAGAELEDALPRYRVLRSEDVDDESDPPCWFVEDHADPDDPVPVDTWYDTEAEAVARAAALNAGGAR